jgi:hypothetical protein
LGSGDQGPAMALPLEMSPQPMPINLDELEVLGVNRIYQALEIIQR